MDRFIVPTTLSGSNESPIVTLNIAEVVYEVYICYFYCQCVILAHPVDLRYRYCHTHKPSL